MSRSWLAFLLLATIYTVVKANGIYTYYYTYPGISSGGYALNDPSSPYQLLMPYPLSADCDKEKKEGSEGSSSEGGSSEGGSSETSGEKEKEGGSSSSEESKPEGEPKSEKSEEEEKGEKAEKAGSEESSSESSSESGSSEEAESNKVKSGSALFPPRAYIFPPRSVPQVASPYYAPSYKAYSLMQPYSYPVRTSYQYQYYPVPAARVVSSKLVSSPVVYSNPSTNILPTMPKGYSYSPGARVVAASWNPGYAYYKR